MLRIGLLAAAFLAGGIMWIVAGWLVMNEIDAWAAIAKLEALVEWLKDFSK